MDIARVGEFRMLEHIGRLAASQKDPRILLGPGDDCALVRARPGYALALTADEMAEGTHFPAGCPPALLGRKLARINLSDLAGMGNVKPVCALCCAGLPRNASWEWTKTFVRALMKELNRFGASLAGGNLARSDKMHFSLTVTGEARPSEIIRRGGAKPGDLIFGIGALGQARAGLELVLSGHKTGKLVEAFWLPRIQPEAGAVIGKKKLASAMMDNSDGLYKSVKTLAAASGCGAFIDITEDALSPELARYCKARKKDWREYILSGGEDYGLVMAVPPRRAAEFIKTFPRARALGVMTKGKTIHANCRPESFEHF
ncbi:MAG: thiamine-phosphate kinase [Elusimicrobiales bacterium]